MNKKIIIIVMCLSIFLIGSDSSSQIFSYFNLNKTDLLKKLGNDYQIVQTGPEGTYEGYRFDKVGVIIVFNDESKVDTIECSQKIRIQGASAGMNFKQIQSKLGKSDVIETWIESPENKAYELQYVINGFKLIFMSSKKDGSNSGLVIFRINEDLG